MTIKGFPMRQRLARWTGQRSPPLLLTATE